MMTIGEANAYICGLGIVMLCILAIAEAMK
jgi:hypothetical protein